MERDIQRTEARSSPTPATSVGDGEAKLDASNPAHAPLESCPPGHQFMTSIAAAKKGVAKVTARAASVSKMGTYQLHQSALALRKSAAGWMNQHERALSLAGMIGGFAFDNFTFRRIDLPNTQLIFIGYLALAAVSMAVFHRLAARAAKGLPWPKWRALLPMATQFALGGLWSAFLIFYSRGAVLGESWPFLLVLTAIFIGNEVFKHYHSRLVFTAVLFFFALFSYSIVTLPLFTHTIGVLTFIASGTVALAIFWFFLGIIRLVGREQWKSARWQIGAGALLVYATLNAFYFTGILPPLPLAMADAGIYHSVRKTGDKYQAVGENQTWVTKIGAPPVMHVAKGEPLYFYSAVFAPIKFSTRIIHRWQHFDSSHHKWRTVSKLAFTINGGRDGGYRGYSVSHRIVPGDWRVDVALPDGHIIGRVRFRVEPAAGTASLSTKVLS